MSNPEYNPLAPDLDAVVQIMGERWRDLEEAQVLVTGGTGFVGRWLLETFAWANRVLDLRASAVVLSRDPAAFFARAPHLAGDPTITLIQGDVRTFRPPSGPFTHIIHAATDSSAPDDPLRLVDTIVGGTRNVLDMAREHGSPRMLYVSSGAVYGRSRSAAEPCGEDDRTAPLVSDPTIEYDEAKRMAEALCSLYHRQYGLPVTIARGFTFVGPHLPLDKHFAVGNFIRDALSGGPIRVTGDGRAVRSYLYAADLATWLWTILLRGAAGRPYNVGSDETISIAELARLVAEVVNPDSEVMIGRDSEPAAPLNYMAPDISRARTELGLTATVPLVEAIRRTADWARNAERDSPAPGRDLPAVSPGNSVTTSSAELPEVLHAGEPSLGGELVPLRSLSDADELSTWQAIDAIVFDFDGVMTDNRVVVLQDGREAVLCDRSDGLGIGRLRALGLPMLVLSTEVNPVVAARCAKLKLECLQGIDIKEEALAVWLAEREYDPARTIYVGNDINDLGCLQLVGCPVAVGDAYDEVKAVARLILKRPGGHGAVRELADVIFGLLNGRIRDERS